MSAQSRPVAAVTEVPGLAYYTAAQPARSALVAKSPPQGPISRAAEALQRMYDYYTPAE